MDDSDAERAELRRQGRECERLVPTWEEATSLPPHPVERRVVQNVWHWASLGTGSALELQRRRPSCPPDVRPPPSNPRIPSVSRVPRPTWWPVKHPTMYQSCRNRRPPPELTCPSKVTRQEYNDAKLARMYGREARQTQFHEWLDERIQSIVREVVSELILTPSRSAPTSPLTAPVPIVLVHPPSPPDVQEEMEQFWREVTTTTPMERVMTTLFVPPPHTFVPSRASSASKKEKLSRCTKPGDWKVAYHLSPSWWSKGSLLHLIF